MPVCIPFPTLFRHARPWFLLFAALAAPLATAQSPAAQPSGGQPAAEQASADQPPVDEASADAAKKLLAEALKADQIEKALTDTNQALPLALQSKDQGVIIEAYLMLGGVNLLNSDENAGQQAFDTALRMISQAGGSDQVVGALKAALGIARKKNLHSTLMRYLGALADVDAQLSDFKGQAEALSEALELVNPETDMKLACDIVQQLLPIYQKLDDPQGLGNTFAGEGNCRKLANDPEGAFQSFQKSIEALRKTDDKSTLSAVLDMTAENLRARGRVAEALPYQQEAVNIRRTLDEPRHLAQSLNDLSLTFEELGRLPDALKNIEESLALTRKVGNDDDKATVLTNAAAVYRDLGRFDQATTLLTEALTIARAADLKDRMTAAMKIMATVHAAQGDVMGAAAAEAVASDNAEENAGRKLKEGEEPAYMKSHNMAVALVKMGNYGKAIEIFQGLLKEAEAGKDAVALASAHEGLALAYAESTEFSLAESNLRETERIYRQLGNPRALTRTLANLSALYTRMGRYNDALDIDDEVARISLSLEDIRMQIEVLQDTADLYRRLKSYDQALDDAQHALELSQKNGFKDQVGAAQQTMGLVHLARENYPEAERLFREAESNAQAKAVIDEGVVEVYLATKRYQQALDQLALVSAEQLERSDPGYKLQYYTQRGIARLGLGDINQAVSDFNLAIDRAEEMRTESAGPASLGFLDSGSFGGRVRPYRGMLEAFGMIAALGLPAKTSLGDKDSDPASVAFHYAELTRGRSLVEKLATSRIDDLRKQIPASFLAEEQQISDRMIALAKETEERRNRHESISEQAAELEKLRALAKVHMAAMEKNYPMYARVLTPSAMPAEELPLAKDEAVLEYGIGLNNVYLFIVTSGHPVRVYRLATSPDDLEAKVNAFRNLVVARRFSPSLAIDLFRRLLPDPRTYAELPKKLIIVPDGVLGLLPFEALVTAQGAGDPTYLGFEHLISYAQSASVLAWTRNFTRHPAEKPLFALADPIFSASDPRYQAPQAAPSLERVSAESAPKLDASAASASTRPPHVYRRLPETQNEVDSLASIVGVEPRPPDVLVGDSATKAALASTNLGAYRYLHFATHAAVLGEPGRVNEPFLVLNQVGNSPGDDGLLKMSEIMNLKLNAELVVLGACDTGRGDVLQGDGVASLASAFQFAGSESVVLSLWELPSEATLPFMQNFYQFLKQGHSKAEALQLSRDAMRKQHPDPYYWAVFAIYGGSGM